MSRCSCDRNRFRRRWQLRLSVSKNIDLWRHLFSRVTFDSMFPLHLNHKASQLGSRFWNI